MSSLKALHIVWCQCVIVCVPFPYIAVYSIRIYIYITHNISLNYMGTELHYYRLL